MGSRTMVYPYTLCAKFALFPYKFYYNKSPFFMGYAWAFLVSIPFFYKMQQLTCSEANYVKYAEYQRKEREEYQHHSDHLD